MAECDFSELPEVVWVEIMLCLGLADRSRLARTCHILNDVFNHPSLWQEIIINMMGDTKPYTSKRDHPVTIAEKDLMLTKRFGLYFQDLTLRLHGFVKTIPQECRDILCELSKDCRLEKLTLEVGTMVTHDATREHFSVVPKDDDLNGFAELIRNSFRLKSFILTTWPRFEKTSTLDILQELIKNPRLKHLEELSLFSFNARQGSWTTNNALLPAPEEIHSLVEHFTNLTTLRLRSIMLNDDIVEELSKPGRQSLKHFEILVTYRAMEKATSMKTISSTAWLRLKCFSPSIQVHFTIMTRVPHLELATLFKPEIPLHSISFMRYSRCDQSDIESITNKYWQTLTKFVDYSDSNSCEEALLTLVQQCKSMNHLIYNGTLGHCTVLKLAQCKGKQWHQFNVNIDNIRTTSQQPDDDCVLRVTSDGQYKIPIVWNYEPEQVHQQIIDELTVKLSQCLLYKWCPFTEKTMFI